MRWTDVRVGYACNQACRFCDLADRVAAVKSGAQADPPLDSVVAALRALPHREGVVLAGGEVTVRADLPDLVERARGLGFRRIAVQTNGQVLAAPGAATHLRGRGLTDVAVALHSPDLAVHDWLVGVPGAGRRAAAAVRQAKAAGLAVRIHAVVTRTTTPQAPALVALAARLGASAVRFAACREAGSAVGEARMLAPRLASMAESVAAALDVARAAGLEVETLGLPLCLHAGLRPHAADRRDAPQPDRAFVLDAEPSTARVYPEVCGGCALRQVCPGVEVAYAARWGDAELAPVGGRPPAPEELVLDLAAGQTARTLRQRLVQAQAVGVRRVRFIGEDTTESPDRPALGRECERLGLVVVA